MGVCGTGIHRAVPSRKNHEPPSSEPWIHEIKHDGFRIVARKNR